MNAVAEAFEQFLQSINLVYADYTEKVSDKRNKLQTKPCQPIFLTVCLGS